MRKLRNTIIVMALLVGAAFQSSAQGLRLAVAGLNHNHVYGILYRFENNGIEN
jgi:hypothetical protein